MLVRVERVDILDASTMSLEETLSISSWMEVVPTASVTLDSSETTAPQFVSSTIREF